MSSSILYLNRIVPKARPYMAAGGVVGQWDSGTAGSVGEGEADLRAAHGVGEGLVMVGKFDAEVAAHYGE